MKKMVMTLGHLFPNVMKQIRVGRGKKYRFICDYRLKKYTDMLNNPEDNKISERKRYDRIFDEVDKDKNIKGFYEERDLYPIAKFLYMCVNFDEKTKTLRYICEFEELLSRVPIAIENEKEVDVDKWEDNVYHDGMEQKKMLLFKYLEVMRKEETQLFRNLKED